MTLKFGLPALLERVFTVYVPKTTTVGNVTDPLEML